MRSVDDAVQVAAEALALAWRHWGILLVAGFIIAAVVCNAPECGGKP